MTYTIRLPSGSSAQAVKHLRNRSDAFLRAAEQNSLRGLYDVACFEADQASQLALKAGLLQIGGSFVRTHSLRRILAELGRLTRKQREISRFVSERRAEITMLEDAYLRTRYAAEAYEKEDALACLKIAKEVIQFAQRLATASSR